MVKQLEVAMRDLKAHSSVPRALFATLRECYVKVCSEKQEDSTDSTAFPTPYSLYVCRKICSQKSLKCPDSVPHHCAGSLIHWEDVTCPDVPP